MRRTKNAIKNTFKTINVKRIYHLSTCSTCQRIIKELAVDSSVEMIDIKSTPFSTEELDWLKEHVGSYEALFSKRAIKFRSLGLHEQELTENDYRKHLLSEYTFLKRPVMINGEEVFIGNAKQVVLAAKQSFNS